MFKSIWSPTLIGVSCWIGGHLWYPGRFVLMHERSAERAVRWREFGRMTIKAMIAMHRIHLPFVLAWSVLFGIICKPFRVAGPSSTNLIDEE